MHASLKIDLQMQQWHAIDFYLPFILVPTWSQQTTKTTFDVDLENKKIERKIKRDSN